MQTIKCKKCGKEMNVATGTFGGGIPKDCPDCKRELDYQLISEGWNAKSNMKTIKVYTTKTCHFCKEVKNFLDENKIEYQTIDVGESVSDRKDMIELSGQMGVPVIVINDKVIVGFNKDSLKSALNIK